MSLTGKTKASTYKDILQMNNSNSGIDTTVRNVVDGEGTASSISISDDNLHLKPVNDDNSALLRVLNKAGDRLLVADSSNMRVTAGAGQFVVNTQYAHFGVGASESANFVDDTHHPIVFNGQQYSLNSAGNAPSFGTGTDPATTFTTADSNGSRASDLIPVIMYVTDNITIDEIYHLEGADNATGDTTRMHLMSYTFNSGATGALTSGAVVANTSADNTNAGSEQPYRKTWSIGTADIDSGKVLLCMFKSDSINSDYSLSVTIKYHLR